MPDSLCTIFCEVATLKIKNIIDQGRILLNGLEIVFHVHFSVSAHMTLVV